MLFKFKTRVRFRKIFFRNKAASDGAISFYLDHVVRTRVSKVTYGSFFTPRYNASDPDHRSRSHEVFIGVSGEERINGAFDVILPKVSCLITFLKSMFLTNFYLKNTQVSETKEFRSNCCYVSSSADFRAYSDSVWCYRGNIVTPKWKDVDTSESHLTIVYLV